ncbi:MAG: hypothetical protein P0S94_03665 [Simkaniaceae bacterium]|nr:hypothetical protein [Simkaniaceae bacterium]
MSKLTSANEYVMIKPFLVTVSLLIFFTSCSRQIDLAYDPVIEKVDKRDVNVVVNRFEDVRKIPHVGSMRNLYGMPIVKLHTKHDVPEWVTEAVKLELENAGYSISDTPTDGDAYEVNGKVMNAYATSYFIYHGRMSIEVVVMHGGDEVLRKVYQTNKHGGLNWLAQPKSFTRTLKLNLQEVCRNLITDVNRIEEKDSNL